MEEPVAGQASFRAGWSAVDQASDPAAYVRFMDRFRPPDADTARSYGPAFALLDPRPGERILDAGCGTGGAVRALAALVAPDGLATGIDLSATIIDEALRRAVGTGLPAHFRTGDAHALPFADETFDACYSGGSLDIMDDPGRAVAELVRVTRSGGRLVLTGSDVGTWALPSEDCGLTRRILDFICDHERQGWLGRQLPGIMSSCGLAGVTLTPVVGLNTDLELFAELYLRTYLEHAQHGGAISAEEATSWLAELQGLAADGRFFLVSTLFLVRGNKP